MSRNAGGSLTNKPEDEVLAVIKCLAVREENSMVARVQLHNMRQDLDETVRSFGARLRGQTSVCKFTIECPSCKKGVDYTNAILLDVLTHGIADADIQLDLLSAENQDMSLEEAFKFIEAKEAGKRSASRLLDSHGAEAARSTYRTQQKASLAPQPDNWIGLDLFNDDTRPSGHISHPTQVNVSQSCFHSLNNYSSLILLYTYGG